MKPKILIFVGFILLVVSCATANHPHACLSDNTRSQVVLLKAEKLCVSQDEVDKLWNFILVITNTSSELPPPQIYFAKFDPRRMDSDFMKWQQGWVREARLNEYPWGDMYEGYFYTGTGMIQIDPQLFIVRNKNGDVECKTHDEGTHIIGHEMVHYIFEQKDVPPFLHHCIMDEGGYDRNIVSYIEHKSVHATFLSGICENTPPEIIEYGMKKAREPLLKQYK